MRAHRGRARARRSDGRSDDGTFKNLYNNDLTTEGTARVILPVLLFARLTLSFSLSFPRVPLPVLSVPRTFSLPLAPLLPVRRLPRERDGALYLSRSRSYSPLVCTAVRHLLNCVRRCPLLLLPPPSPCSFFSPSSSFTLSSSSSLPLRRDAAPLRSRELANVIGLPKIKSSSALSCPLVSRSLSFAPLPSRIYARAKGLYKCERERDARGRSAHRKEL